MTGPGDVLAERYTLMREAARMPHGSIWQARDATLDRRVHVLLLDAEAAKDRSRRRAFIDEAAQRAAVTDPYLAAVYDIGTDPPFVIFEDPGGGRLAERLRTGPLDAQLAARIAANVARGVQALERRGDAVPAITAGVVLLSSDGRGKLIPLGTTATSVDPRRDLAALTILMLTGNEPVDGKVPRREIPSQLADVLTGMLSGDPSRSPTLDAFVDACAALTRPQPVRAERRRARGARGDLGWLFGVVAIVALAIVAVVLGPDLIAGLDNEPSGKPSGDATGNPPAGAAIPIVDIRDFDPEGDDAEEHRNEVSLAIDGDPRTAWTTVGYAAASMAPKSGVGLLVDLGTPRTVAELRVQTTLAGWKAEIRVGDTGPTSAQDLEVATTFTAGSDNRVTLPNGTSARFVLVWLTKLTDDGGGSTYPFRGAIAELELFA